MTVESAAPFLPEPLTPLYHTPVYARLEPRQRLRYNQLHGLYVNEQILFFEQALADSVLGALLSRPLPAGLERALGRFREDEAAHSVMFRALNRAYAPAWYGDRDYHFVRVSAGAFKVLGLVGRRPSWCPMLIWLMLLLEERALYFGGQIVQHASVLDPRMVATHARHLRDEARHVQWDQDVLDWLWPRTPPALRRMNAALFRWLVGEFFSVPRRAGLAVARELAASDPVAAPHLATMIDGLRGLAGSPAFHATLYSRQIVPRTFRRFDRWPEFSRVGRALRAYAPAGAP
jgi:P-aminobenzoate N-oxygenase AurF